MFYTGLNSQMALKALSSYKNMGLEVLLLSSFRDSVFTPGILM